jgi:beta-lactamase class A
VRFPALVVMTALSLQHTPAPGLESEVRNAIARTGADVAVAVRSLDGRIELAIDADAPFHAASTMKVPVMIELYRQAAAGQLSLDDPLTIRNEFRSIVDGSPYSLSEGDDSDRTVYAALGRTMTLRELCEVMITASSNFAANLLIDRLGAANIQRTTEALGAAGMHVRRGVEDQKAFDRGLNNTTSARALLVLFDALAHGRAVSPAADAEMVAILKRQQAAGGIPAGLPPGTPVAHKTGTITRIHHDAGIVYGPRPYVLVVLTRGFADEQNSDAFIAAVTRMIDARVRQP